MLNDNSTKFKLVAIYKRHYKMLKNLNKSTIKKFIRGFFQTISYLWYYYISVSAALNGRIVINLKQSKNVFKILWPTKKYIVG